MMIASLIGITQGKMEILHSYINLYTQVAIEVGDYERAIF